MNRCASLIRGNLTWARYDLHLITIKTFNNFSTVIVVKSSLSNLTNSASESWFYQTCHSSLSDDNSSISLFYGWGKNVTWTTLKNQINNHHSNQSQYSLQWKKLLNSLFLQIWAVWKELQSNRLHCISVERCWPKSNAGRHELCILPRESFLASPSSSFHKRSLLPSFFLVQMKSSQSSLLITSYNVHHQVARPARERAGEGGKMNAFRRNVYKVRVGKMAIKCLQKDHHWSTIFIDMSKSGERVVSWQVALAFDGWYWRQQNDCWS